MKTSDMKITLEKVTKLVAPTRTTKGTEMTKVYYHVKVNGYCHEVFLGDEKDLAEKYYKLLIENAGETETIDVIKVTTLSPRLEAQELEKDLDERVGQLMDNQIPHIGSSGEFKTTGCE